MNWVILCDHASCRVPEELAGLGLERVELEQHIGWDIGALGVAERLGELLGAPVVASRVSRLVVDCNRHVTAADLMPEVSDGTVVPGNLGLTEEARAERVARWYWPYHEEAERVIDGLGRPGLISMHTMTPRMGGVERPWAVALSSYRERGLNDRVLAALRAQGGFLVGDNEPYDLDPAVDFSTPYHAMRRGLVHLQVEVRQDEVGTEQGQRAWAERIAAAVEVGLLYWRTEGEA